MPLGRWTPLTYLLPGRYIETGPTWEGFEFRDWADGDYEWIQDPWNGFLDFAKRPSATVEDGRGDCEDFALVAASWAVAQGHDDVGLAFCWESTRPWPTHVVAYDSEAVYSSGVIEAVTVDDWLADSKYAFALRRRVT